MIEQSIEDPLCYTKMDEFTSEVFKIEIGGLPRLFGYTQLKKLLNHKLQLKAHKIKTVPQSSWAFVTFKSEDDRERALQVLAGYKWRGRTLTVKKANPAADPLIKKRQNADAIPDDIIPNKNLKLEISEETYSEQIMNAVMPLWKIPYDDQIKTKESEVKKQLIKVGRQIEKTFSTVPTWLQENRNNFEFLCCEYAGIKRSPVTTRYRNKCEFTVGLHPDGKRRLVGFRHSKYSAGSTFVGEPYDCSIIPEAVLNVCKSFQEYIETSDKAPFNPIDHSGYWRQLTVRYTTNEHLMAIAIMHPQQLTSEEIIQIKEDLNSYFSEGAGKNSRLTSLYFQTHSKKLSGDALNFEHVRGEKHMVETLLGIDFRVSPNAFFQINTAAAEVLYSTIGEIANVNEKTVVLDICCSTGAIGISLAKKVQKVIGIEVVASAIEDAKYNAEKNELLNTEFICGKVEDCLTPVLYRFSKDDDVVAIVDPPRPGLHNKVVRSIRSCKALTRLVYVACDFAAASTNIVDFCRPESKQYRCSPFVIKRACAVDLFPQTPHCEIVLLLERTPNQSQPALENTKIEAELAGTNSEILKSTD